MKKIFLPLIFLVHTGFGQCNMHTSCDDDHIFNIDEEPLTIKLDLESALQDMPKLKDPYRDEIRFNLTLLVDGKRVHTVYDYFKKSDDAEVYNSAAKSKSLEIIAIPDASYSSTNMNDDLTYMGKLLSEFSPGKHDLEIKFGPSGQYKKKYLCSQTLSIEISQQTQTKINQLVATIKSNNDNAQANKLTLPESKMTNRGISKQIGEFYSDEFNCDARIIISDKDWTVFKDDTGKIKYRYVHVATTWEKDGKHYVDYNLVSQKYDGTAFTGPYDLQKKVNPKLITIK